MTDRERMIMSVARVLGPLSLDDRSSLTHAELTFCAVFDLEGQVNNGGLHQYYFNSSGDEAVDAVRALREIGASCAAAIVERANAIFGAAGPSPHRYTRQAQLDLLDDDAFDALTVELLAYPDPLSDLLAAYVDAHRAAIRGPRSG